MARKMAEKIDSFWGIKEKGSSVKVEIIAGLVTFLAMCYILTVNPNQIFYKGTGDPRWSSLFIATAFGAIIGTLLMAFLAKMPLAQASGMGLNSLVGSIIGGGMGLYAYEFKFTLGQAFLMVLISGVIFVLVTLIKIKGKSLREIIFDGMPKPVRTAISVGIGLFIAYIGFQNAGIIVSNQYTQVALVDFSALFKGDATVSATSAIVCLFGVMVIAILDKLNVKGSVIFGIIGATLLGIVLGVTNLDVIKGQTDGISWKFWENFEEYFTGENSVFLSFVDGIKNPFPSGSLFTVIMLVITMCMIDMFDTMGTIVGCCGGNRVLSDENNKPYHYGEIMMSDAIGTCAGAICGTSTVTTFVESGAGVAAGGRTGLTAFTTAILFFLAIFLLPAFAVIPSAASSSALIYVGVLMMKNNVKSVDFSNAINAVSAFLTIIIMCLAYSITKGIGIGVLTYTIMSLLSYVVEVIVYACKKDKTVVNENGETVEAPKPKCEVSVVAVVISILFAVYFFVPTVL